MGLAPERQANQSSEKPPKNTQEGLLSGSFWIYSTDYRQPSEKQQYFANSASADLIRRSRENDSNRRAVNSNRFPKRSPQPIRLFGSRRLRRTRAVRCQSPAARRARRSMLVILGPVLWRLRHYGPLAPWSGPYANLDRSTLKVQHVRGVAISAHERIIFQHQSELPDASDDIDSPY